jgi:hypothetical protein
MAGRNLERIAYVANLANAVAARPARDAVDAEAGHYGVEAEVPKLCETRATLADSFPRDPKYTSGSADGAGLSQRVNGIGKLLFGESNRNSESPLNGRATELRE